MNHTAPATAHALPQAAIDIAPGDADPAAQLLALRSGEATEAEHSVVEVLLARMLDRGDERGLVDIAYRTVDSPLGPLLIASTDAGVVRLAFGVQGHDRVLDDLAASISPRILRMPRKLDRAATELDQYFRGLRTAFTVPVDMQLAHGFRRSVLDRLPHIPYGRTAGYAEIATAAGRAHAARSVGTACAKNPVPIIVPCHRVVRSDGSLGGYVGGPDAKRNLLDIESQSLERGIDFGDADGSVL